MATKANSIANSDAELVRATAYNDLSSQTRQTVPNTGFQHEVLLGNESDYSKGIKQRTVTILVYKGNESTPRVSLPVTRYSTEKEFSGVPIGTVIAWAGEKAPATNGTWLECYGQSCAAYPALTAVLGKNTVPDYRGRFLETDTTVGTVKEAGLPNITGILSSDPLSNDASSEPITCADTNFSGAFRAVNFQGYYTGYSYTSKNTNYAPGAILFDSRFHAETSSGSSGSWVESFPASGTAPSDGIIVCTSRWNTDMSITISGKSRTNVNRRDKYGQGVTNATCPIAKGEPYSISGAGRICFFKL